MEDRIAWRSRHLDPIIGDAVAVVNDTAVSDCHAGTTTAVGERDQIEGACYGVVADDAVGDRHGSPRTIFSGLVVEPGE